MYMQAGRGHSMYMHVGRGHSMYVHVCREGTQHVGREYQDTIPNAPSTHVLAHAY